MGTSGAYGGSNSAEWNDFRDAWADLDSGSAGAGTSGVETTQPSDQLFEPSQPASDLDRVGQALINALWRDDPATRGNVVPPITRPRVSGRRGAGAGGPGGAGTGGGFAGSGRSGSRSTRQVIGGASRGGATIGAAYALRNRDAQRLVDYGLSLTEFDSLSPRARISRLVTLMIGDDGHPDDRAIRQAATEQVKRIVAVDGEPPTATEAIKGFVSAYIFQLGLVELQDQIINGTLDGNEAVVRERVLRGWIDAKVRGLDVDASPALSANALHQAAAGLAQRAIRVLRAR
ncbi:hypothetical protein GCM10023216_19580 [Isoptericola chiayiensis]|uniref:Uncharacterized protein n=2 Tax=Isoptericola chiayiensis TaxID=579446 RepID=A0ABP8YIK3_9MICO